MSNPTIQTARNGYICEECGRKIPKGDRYWRKHIEGVIDVKEHTNCLLYEAKEFEVK